METPFRNALCEPVLQVLGVLLPVTARLSEMKVSKHFFCPCYPPKSSSLHLVLPHCLRAAGLPLVGSEPSPGRSDPFTARTAFPPSERWKPDSSIPQLGLVAGSLSEHAEALTARRVGQRLTQTRAQQRMGRLLCQRVSPLHFSQE